MHVGASTTPFFSIFTIVFIAIVGFFLFRIVKGVAVWSSNNAAEIVTVPALVVAKRTEVSGGAGNTSAHTDYYVTFEFENGRRLELKVRGNEFGLMAEQDRGTVTYQGTRFHQFNRM